MLALATAVPSTVKRQTAPIGTLATKVHFVRQTDITNVKMLRNGRMAALEKLHRGTDFLGYAPLWAVPYDRPENLNNFRDYQGVFKFNANISHCTVHLGMTQQKLNETQDVRLIRSG